MSDEVTAIAEHFIAIEAITFVLLHPVMHVLDVNVEVTCLVKRFSAHFADLALDLRVNAFVRLQLGGGFEGFATQ